MLMKNLWILLVFFIPFGLFAAEKQIIGKDDRRQIPEIREEFHRSVGMIEYEGRSNTYCTGTLIAPRHIITNAHCVVANKEKPAVLLEPSVIKFTPGKLSAEDAPLGTIRGVAIHTFDEWIATRSGEWDLAVVELESEVMSPQVKLWPFRLADLPHQAELWLAGYSAGKPYGTMWEGPGTFLRVLENGQQFHHSIDTQPGTSGALIRYRWKGQWYGVGIHRGTGWPVLNVNAGVLLNKRVYDAVSEWLGK
jgi:V8-like Glu-specific endopeptidase